MKQRSRLRRGATIIEAVTAATLTVTVLTVSVAAFLQGMTTWARGSAQIDSDVSAQQTMRRLTQELRESMSVTVSADGKSVSYRLPRKEADGSYRIPAEWDGVARRAYVATNANGLYDLYTGPESSPRLLSKIITLDDPERVATQYRPFTPGLGSLTRQLTIMLATKSNGDREKKMTHRIRETLQLRNVPSLTR